MRAGPVRQSCGKILLQLALVAAGAAMVKCAAGPLALRAPALGAARFADPAVLR